MKALVLIGGFGTRLRPVTYSVPKQLIPIAGKPMVYHTLDLLPPEVDEAVFATGYKAELIDAYVREHPPRVKVTTVPEAEPLGSGGGMRNAGDSMSDPFVLLNSDIVAEIDVGAMIEFHRAKGAFGTIFLGEAEDTRPYGVAALDGQDRIGTFVEKPEPQDAPSHWINAGIQIWRREVLERIPRGRMVSFEREILPGVLDRGVYGFRGTGYWEDAGTLERLLHAQRLLFDAGRGGPGRLPHGAVGNGPVAFGASVSARGASFGPHVTLGDRVSVEAGAFVQNAVVMEGATVGADASVIGSLVGPRARVAPGARVEGQILAADAGG
jgi:mannose-1-phosphate guanylyltransferase